MGRGAFIVIEGCDRSGKTTISKNIVDSLIKMKIKAEYMNFPDRSTVVGKLIDDYLCKRINLSDKAIHLLFTSNRWELDRDIRNKLEAGVTLIVDRYSYSGVAYSSIKPGMDIDWCKNPESGLPKPDLVLYLDLPVEEIARRSGFGDERYDKMAIQEKVAAVFKELRTSSWVIIDATKEEEDLMTEILPLILETRKTAEPTPVTDMCGEKIHCDCCPHLKWGEYKAELKEEEDKQVSHVEEKPDTKSEEVKVKEEEKEAAAPPTEESIEKVKS